MSPAIEGQTAGAGADDKDTETRAQYGPGSEQQPLVSVVVLGGETQWAPGLHTATQSLARWDIV